MLFNEQHLYLLNEALKILVVQHTFNNIVTLQRNCVRISYQ